LKANYIWIGLCILEVLLSISSPQEKDCSSHLRKQEHALEVTKEIIIKFIEAGQVTPSSFQETFRNIYSEIKKALSL